MNRIELVSLEMSHFRSVKDTERVEFAPHGLIQIIGKNLDTGGSSAAGKSLILLALNAALDCAPYPMTELQNWDTTEPAQVKLELKSSRYGRVVRTVGAKNKLEVEGEKAITSAKKIAERMQQILGVNPEIVAALTYRQQQAQSDFLTMTNSAKQDFLSVVLGLERFEKAVQLTKEAIDGLQRRLDSSDTGMDIAHAAVGRAEEDLKQFFSQYGAETPAVVDKSYVLYQLDEEREQIERELEDCNSIQHIEPNTAGWFARTDQELAAQVSDSGLLERISTLQAQVQRERAELAKVQASLTVDTDEQLIKLRGLVSFGKVKLTQVETSEEIRLEQHMAVRQRIDASITSTERSIADSARAKQQLNQFQADLKKLEDQTCPTCQQTWLKAADRAAQLRNDVTKLEAQVALIPALQLALEEARTARRAEVWVVNPLIAEIKAGITNLEAEARAREQVIREGQKTMMQTLSGTLRNAEEALNKAYQEQSALRLAIDTKFRNEHQAYLNRRSRIEKRMLANESDARTAKSDEAMAAQRAEFYRKERDRLLAEVDKKKAEEQVKLDENSKLEDDLNAEKDLLKMIGREGFMGVIFDEIIAEIAAETNLILSRVANTSHVVLEFRSEPTPAGKPEIRAIVTVGGHEWPMRSACSGGMWSALRLAVHIARRRVLARRTGMDLCWLGLDEPFDGMDEVSKEPAMEILAEAAKECLIFVVDHSERFKSLFAKKLTVEYKAGITRVI